MTLLTLRRAGRGALLAGLVVASVVVAQSPAQALRDSDHDGLPNKWEKGKTPQGLSLKKLGADAKHRDVFVELNYSTNSGKNIMTCAALDKLYNALKNAPLKNPDGKSGIRLHLDAGKKCSSRSYDLGGSSRFTVTNKPGLGKCATPSDAGNSMAMKRLNVFHIGAVVDGTELCTAEGQATQTDFLVKDQNGDPFFAYVALHELGHVFGLDHSAFNAFSVMSGGAYTFGNTSPGSQVVDFTRYPVKSKDETTLDESVGWESTTAAGNTWLKKFYAPQYCSGGLNLMSGNAGPVDWDCDGAPFWMPPFDQYIDDTPVSYDVNNDGTIGTVPAVPAEWPKVKLNLGRIGK